MTRFVVCGETLIDLDPVGRMLLELPGGQHLAGAVGGGIHELRRGARQARHETHFLGRLSTDAFGQQLRSYIDCRRSSARPGDRVLPGDLASRW